MHIININIDMVVNVFKRGVCARYSLTLVHDLGNMSSSDFQK